MFGFLTEFGITSDVLRLLILPVFVYFAWMDVKTRQIYDNVWIPLIGLAFLTLTWDIYSILLLGEESMNQFLIALSSSIIIIPSIAFLLWEYGILSGGADLKAFAVLALLFPTEPTYTGFGIELPLVEPYTPMFTLTVLTNTLLLSAIPPTVLFVINLYDRRIDMHMFFTRIVTSPALHRIDGEIWTDSSDSNDNTCVDLDVLRLYLRWRQISMDELVSNPKKYKYSLPQETVQPTTGSIDPKHSRPLFDPINQEMRQQQPTKITKENISNDVSTSGISDRWAAEMFCADLDTTRANISVSPDEVRKLLDKATKNDTITVHLHFPLFVLIALGLLLSLTIGDVIKIIG